MRVFVCVRVIPNCAQVTFSRSRGAIDDAEAEREISVADRSALAVAGMVKRGGGAEVIALSWAPASDEPVLRQALAAGATRLQRIEAPMGDDADPLVAAKVLSGALRDQKPDLVLFGEASADLGRAAVGPMVAELLGLPFLASAQSLRIENGRIAGELWVDDRLIGVAAPFPAAVSIAAEAATPAKPSPLAMMKAFRSPVEVLPAEASGAALLVRGYSSNDARRRGNEVLEAPTVTGALDLLAVRLRERRVI